MVTAMATVPAAAYAQDTANLDQDAASGSGDEIIVTAQKRSERAIDVPLSITAASGEQLVKAGVTSVADLGKITPGFSYQPNSYGQPTLFIRGMGFFNNATAITPAVSVYVDQVPLSFPSTTAGAMLDLERVEVLKGPQGTLFGQNSTGGAVNFIAAKPTDELSFGGHAEYARFDQVNLGGFISGPISQTLGVRLALSTEQGGAWQKSVTRPNDRLGDRDLSTGRLTLDWNPDDIAHISFTASGWIDKSETRAAQYVRFSPISPNYPEPVRTLLLAQPTAPSDSRFADWNPNTDLRQDSKFYQLALRGDFDISESTALTTITAYSNYDSVAPVDTDGTAVNNILSTTSAKIEGLFQEVRLAGDGSQGNLKWMIGANYSYDETTETRMINISFGTNNGVGPRRYNVLNNVNNINFKTVSLFGSMDYKISDAFTISGSARYTDQSQNGKGGTCDVGDGVYAAAFSLLSTVPFSPGDCVTLRSQAGLSPYPPVGGLVERSLKEDNLSWRGNLSWKPNNDLHIYANVTKGYKAGAFSTLPVVFDTQYNPVPQEAVLQYEAGFKLAAANRTVQLSGAAFYSDYTRKQLLAYVLTPFGNLPGLISVPKSRVAGAELELVWRPIEGLRLNGGVTYVDTKVKSSSIVRDPFGVNIDINGYRFPSTPKWQASGGAEYTFPLSDAVNGFVGASLTYRSSTPLTFGGGAEFVAPAYTLVDLRAGVETPDGKWRGEVWGRNIFNKFYLTNTTHIIDTVARITGTPATYGIRISRIF